MNKKKPLSKIKVFILAYEKTSYAKGYGTEAEKLAINYAFDEMGMVAVNTHTVLKNIRSQHVLWEEWLSVFERRGRL